MTADSVALATAFADVDSSWGTTVAPIADGWAVLCGPGMFVNRLEGAGIDTPLTAGHLDELERLARVVGVSPEVALPDFADEANSELLTVRGYEPDSAVSISSLRPDEFVRRPARFRLETVDASQELAQWQRAAAIGWGHHADAGRRASDAFAAAAARAPGSSLFLVRNIATGGVVATCALTIRDGVATLGGMSVLPTERRRGVQEAAITLRLAAAIEHGCDLAATSTVVDGDSERNVARYGFVVSHRIVSWRRVEVENPV